MKNKPSKLSELKRAAKATRKAVLARAVPDPSRPFTRIPYRGRKYLVIRRSGGVVRSTYRCSAFVVREVS